MFKRWPVKMVPQETPAKCWAAAAAMLLGKHSSVGPGLARTSSDGGLLPDRANVEKFARSHGLVLERTRSWTAKALWDIFQRSPIMVMGNVRIPRLGVGGHAYVITEMETDGTGGGTYVTIYDPKPAIILLVNYQARLNRYPLSFFYILSNPF